MLEKGAGHFSTPCWRKVLEKGASGARKRRVKNVVKLRLAHGDGRAVGGRSSGHHSVRFWLAGPFSRVQEKGAQTRYIKNIQACSTRTGKGGQSSRSNRRVDGSQNPKF
jgi:hypothetical protein